MQIEITQPGPLLDESGQLAQVGWARQPIIDCNLENACFYPSNRRFLQRLRVKRWDYYALFTPWRFFSATIADLGYAANVFVYLLDFRTNELVEESLILPSGLVTLPRNSHTGETRYEGKAARLCFLAEAGYRRVAVDWPGFNKGRGLRCDVILSCPPDHESMTIVIPIPGNRFYHNTKINCMPAEGLLHVGEAREPILPSQSLASLDWGRGVWEYRSFWNWSSASGFLPDGRTVGLNLGQGFGDLSRATENALILDGKLHKLGKVTFSYDSSDYNKPWRFTDDEGRLDLTFTPFKERVAKSNLLVITSEVHQMFGRFKGRVTADNGEAVAIDGLIGFAEEHNARW